MRRTYHTQTDWGWTVWFDFASGTDYKCCHKFLNDKIHITKILFALCGLRDCCEDWGERALVSRSSYSTGTSPGRAQHSIQASAESGGFSAERTAPTESTAICLLLYPWSPPLCPARYTALLPQQQTGRKGAEVWSSRWRMRSFHHSLHPPPHIMRKKGFWINE